jgi:hypothetical protein
MFHDFVDDVFMWTLVDDKPKILLDTLHATFYIYDICRFSPFEFYESPEKILKNS